MSLRQPLWLLLILPALAWFVLALFRQPLARVSPLGRLRQAATTWRIRLWWLPELFLWAFFCLGAILLAGPQRPLDGGADRAQGLAMALTLDRSGSMSAIISFQDKPSSRLDAIKAVTTDFLVHRPNDQFALVSFARYPETNTPLTANHQILADFLDLIAVPSNQDEDGTAIGDALVLATARLTQGSKKGVIILLTDGQNNQGLKSPEEGSKIASAAGIPVYCIGLGGDGYIIQDTPNGQVRQDVPEAIDEATLSAIARQTGGHYYHADAPGDLAGFYQDIARRETEKLDAARPQASELNLDSGLWALLVLLVLSLISRHLVLRRMEA